MPSTFEPEPYLMVSDPQQIKAFSDPIRVRIMRILSEEAATNQQLAAALNAPPARILHHVRFLLDTNLVTLVNQSVKGGNVEKYYRATARMYGLNPDPTSHGSLAESVLTSAVSEAVASAALWPDSLPEFEGRRAHISPERLNEFQQKLNALVDDYWGSPDIAALANEDEPVFAFMSMTYRFPGNTR